MGGASLLGDVLERKMGRRSLKVIIRLFTRHIRTHRLRKYRAADWTWLQERAQSVRPERDWVGKRTGTDHLLFTRQNRWMGTHLRFAFPQITKHY